MRWELTLTKGDEVTHYAGETPDPFEALLNASGEVPAQLNMMMHRGRADYGATKVSCSLTINVPQNLAALDNAAQLLVSTALRYANYGMQCLAPEEPAPVVPPMPPPYKPNGR